MNYNSVKKQLKRPQNLFYWFVLRHFRNKLSDECFIMMRYSLCFGKGVNFNNPQTYNEKLQWLKLHDRRSDYTMMVDKYAVKDFVASTVGQKYVIPTYGVWERPEDIEWEKLPKQFVLKTTHDSGGIVICKDKKLLNKERAIEKLKKGLESDFYNEGREWPYKNVPRRIIAEEYIESDPITHDLPDYKFFCFDGEVKALFIATDRQKEGEEVKFDYFTPDFEPLPFKQRHEHAKVMPKKPKHFEEMKEVAAKLSKGIPHVRVDLYECGDRVLFGELTLYHFSGFAPFIPEKWDYIFGEWIKLPKKNC